MKDTKESILAKLDDPNMVGAAEYRAIHETLSDALTGCEDEVAESPRALALAICGEFVIYAQAIRAVLTAVATRRGCEETVCYCHPDPKPAGFACSRCGCVVVTSEVSRG